MRIIGIDYGDKRIGIAVSDPSCFIASPVKTIINLGNTKVLDELEKIINDFNAEKIVLGVPKNMNGTIGERAEKSTQFSELIKNRFKIEVILWDERLTTVSAHKIFNETNVRGKKRKNSVDALAAVLILQTYLDFLKQA